MSVILKYAAICFSFILVVTVVIVFFVNKEDGEYGSNREQKAKKINEISEQNDQKKMFFNFDGNKTQKIDLSLGKAEFNVVYSGDSKFTARLMNSEGTFLVTLADVYGPYNQRQVVEIPETGVYLLDVTTNGEWSLSRK